MVRKKTLFCHLYYIFVENPEFKINQHIILWYQINGLSFLYIIICILFQCCFFCIANNSLQYIFFYTASNSSKTKLFSNRVYTCFGVLNVSKLFFPYFIVSKVIIIMITTQKKSYNLMIFVDIMF
jgi:hypothetical protein